MADKFRYVGRHADHLASGRPIAPGDGLLASHVNADSDKDRQLIEDGLLIEIPAATKTAAKTKKEAAK